MLPKLGGFPGSWALTGESLNQAPVAAEMGGKERGLRAEGRPVELETTSPERIYTMIPAVRVVGPGKRERGYLEKLAALASELEAAALVERGSARRLDRMEKKLEAVREAADAEVQKSHRLILALGSLQRENEMLREKLTLALATPALLPPRRSWLARLFLRA